MDENYDGSKKNKTSLSETEKTNYTNIYTYNTSKVEMF